MLAVRVVAVQAVQVVAGQVLAVRVVQVVAGRMVTVRVVAVQAVQAVAGQAVQAVAGQAVQAVAGQVVAGQAVADRAVQAETLQGGTADPAGACSHAGGIGNQVQSMTRTTARRIVATPLPHAVDRREEVAARRTGCKAPVPAGGEPDGQVRAGNSKTAGKSGKTIARNDRPALTVTGETTGARLRSLPGGAPMMTAGLRPALPAVPRPAPPGSVRRKESLCSEHVGKTRTARPNSEATRSRGGVPC